MNNRVIFPVAIVGCLMAACDPPAPDGASGNSELSRSARDGDLALDDAISRINAQIDAQRLALEKLTKKEFLRWVDDLSPYELIPKARAVLYEGLRRSVLVAPFTLEIVDLSNHGIAPRIVLMPDNEIVIEGTSLQLYTVAAAERACTDDARVCGEGFGGSIPPATAQSFPSSVELRINQTQAPGSCLVPDHCERDILSIELHLTEANVEDAIAYFVHGFDPAAVRMRANDALATTPDGWVRIERLLPNWVGQKASTYPVKGDNEVCHGPARQFFDSELLNGPWDRSTEATSVVLDRYYCRVPDEAPPGFGDYLYIPGAHSGRFILVDPVSQRWVAFSVQSGGDAPYRFWWVDEDFSGHPFSHEPLPDFRKQLVDVWRRCR